MNELHLICASKAQIVPEIEQTSIDLFTLDGYYASYFSDTTHLRRTLVAADCNLVRLRVDGEPAERYALVANWPHPWRGGRISLNEVGSEESIVAFRRVETPEPTFERRWAIAEEMPWVRLQGRTDDVCLGPGVPQRLGDLDRIRARDLVLPKGVELASPPAQILFVREGVGVG